MEEKDQLERNVLGEEEADGAEKERDSIVFSIPIIFHRVDPDQEEITDIMVISQHFWL